MLEAAARVRTAGTARIARCLTAFADEPNLTRAAIGSGARRNRHSGATASGRAMPNTAGRSRP
ncbi:TPA: hypothetical protein QDE50_32045 [Burkholderia cenocepacia]|nr:hypothetical protein [Burkholderia cenocepacia]HDR9888924.1 hypothetical protein [Burkholderia cenocepacia]